MPSEKPFLHFVVDENLLKRVDDFRFRNRFPTRAAAIKWLLDWALKQFKRKVQKAGVLKDLRKKRHYEKPSEVRQRKAAAARRRVTSAGRPKKAAKSPKPTRS
jgi:small subunit ribosomal protein S21